MGTDAMPAPSEPESYRIRVAGTLACSDRVIRRSLHWHHVQPRAARCCQCVPKFIVACYSGEPFLRSCY
jgi:hypothetical protein